MNIKRNVWMAGMAAALLLASCGGKKYTVKTDDKKDVAVATPLSTTFTADVTNSTLGWLGENVTGKKHNGTISITAGTINVENDLIKAGTFTVDMNTIKNSDLPDAKKNGMLVDHLKSADFFDVAKFPTTKFDITGAEKLAAPDSAGNNYKIMGNLTLKDITKNITIPAKVTMDSTKFTAVSKFTIDRSEWNVQYGSGKFFKYLGDYMIKDEITFDLNLVATPQAK